MTSYDAPFFDVGLIACGLFLIFGTNRRWRWLVDPSTAAWPFYSQALIKKLAGRDAVVAFTYTVGAAIAVFGLVSLIR